MTLQNTTVVGHSLKVILIAVFLFLDGQSSLAFAGKQAPVFKIEARGSTPLYNFYDEELQDLSAAAYGQSVVLLGFDGGRNGQFPEVRVTTIERIEMPAKLLPRKIIQKDIEGATYANGRFYIIASQSQTNEDTEDYRLLAELRLDKKTNKIVSERYVFLRKLIFEALQEGFDDTDWFSRVATSFGKLGGINVEGLTHVIGRDDRLLVALRSPLWSKNFGAPVFGDKYSLTQGDAILIEIKSPFSERSVSHVKTLNLQGNGIRGIEYIDNLKGYVIISGPVQKATKFSLWFYQPESETLTKIKSDEFHQLCRPEAVLSVPEKKSVYILSEHSGAACKNQDYNYIKLVY